MSTVSYAIARVVRKGAIAALHYLTNGDASSELAARETEFHHGDDPIEADKKAQEHFEQAVRDQPATSDLNLIAIVGEERIADIPEHAEGARVIVVDPLDGSLPWTIARLGYCVAAIALRALDSSRWEVECALIATPTEVFTLLGSDLLLHGPPDRDPEADLVIASVVPVADIVAKSLAAVACKPDDRTQALAVVAHLPEWAFLTLGGNPVAPYVITGRLTALITLKPASTWDSVGVLMAAATDATVGDHAGTRLSGPDFRQLFAQVLLTGNVTPIPKLIVAKSEPAYDEVVEAVRRSTAG